MMAASCSVGVNGLAVVVSVIVLALCGWGSYVVIALYTVSA